MTASVAATTSRLVAQCELENDHKLQMFDLLSTHFEGVSESQFRRDLNEKNWVLLIERLGKLVGFSTIHAYETTYNGNPFSVIYSGDTIVSPDAWNTPSLPRGWIEAVAQLRRRYPRGPYLWLLLTSGFRTYRLLSLFWHDFYPRWDTPTPVLQGELLKHLARERFGSRYDATKGVVRFENPQRLRADLACIPSGRHADPHIAFFASRNPGHAQGDELVCLAELIPSNLTRAGQRMTSGIGSW